MAHIAQLTYLPELETVFDMITVNAARAMRLEGYGVEPGDRADLVRDRRADRARGAPAAAAAPRSSSTAGG